jgi:hypothetical protein
VKVLVLAPHGAVDVAFTEQLASDEVQVVVWDAVPGENDRRIPVPAPRGLGASLGRRLWRLCGSNAVGRTIYRLTPFDEGAVFWRALRSHPGIDRAAREADLIVAGERDAVFASWKLARRHRRSRADTVVSGYPAALAALAKRTAA